MDCSNDLKGNITLSKHLFDQMSDQIARNSVIIDSYKLSIDNLKKLYLERLLVLESRIKILEDKLEVCLK